MYIKRFVKHYYIMLIPALLWLFFFSIVPMLRAFQVLCKQKKLI